MAWNNTDGDDEWEVICEEEGRNPILDRNWTQTERTDEESHTESRESEMSRMRERTLANVRWWVFSISPSSLLLNYAMTTSHA